MIEEVEENRSKRGWKMTLRTPESGGREMFPE